MIILTILGFMVLLTIALPFGFGYSQQPSENVTNINPLGLKFKYLTNWNVTYDSSKENQCESTCLIILKNMNNSNVTISLYAQANLKDNEKCNCENLLDMIKYQYTTNLEPQNIALLHDNETKIKAGIQAWQMEYELNDKKNYVLWFLAGDKLIELNYYNDPKIYEEYLPEVHRFIDNIELFPPNSRLIVENNTNENIQKPSFMEKSTLQSSSDSPTDTTTQVNQEQEKTSVREIKFNDSNYDQFHFNPDASYFEGINITGKIFNVVPASYGQGALQIYHLGDSDKLLYVSYDVSGSSFYRDDECVMIEGSTQGSVTYKNLFGVSRSSPSISADKITKIECSDLVDPNSKVVNVEQTQEEDGIKVTLHKVEFAKDKTRVFLTIENTESEGEDLRFFDTSDALAFQGKRQFEPVYSFDEDDIASTIPPGIAESGVVVFDALDENQSSEFEFSISKNFDDKEFNFEIGN